MKIFNLVQVSKDLQEIANLKLLDVKSSYRLGVFLNKIEPYLKAYNKSREDLIKQLGKEEVSEKGTQWQVPPENQKQFFTEMNSIGDEEIDVSMPQLLNVSVFKDVSCSPIWFYKLTNIILEPIKNDGCKKETMTVEKVYTSFSALLELGSSLMKGEVQQKLIKTGMLIFESIKAVEKNRIATVEDNQTYVETSYLQNEIEIPFYTFTVEELSAFSIKPLVLGALSWMIEEPKIL